MERCDSMNMRFLLPALAAAALFGGCSKISEKFGRLSGEKTTAVRFADPGRFRAAATPLPGGVMVYALRSDGFRQSILLANESDGREVALPNGTYEFLAVGWDAPGLTGNTMCGFGTPGSAGTRGPFTLTGTAQTIPLQLSTSGCADPTFAPAAFLAGSTFRSPKFTFCSGATVVAMKNATEDCMAGEASSRFFLGYVPGSTGPIEGDYSQATGRMLYTGKAHAGSRIDLFSVGLDGRGTVQQNLKLPSPSNGIKDLRAVPNRPLVVYMGDQDTYDINELYVSVIGHQNSKKINAPGLMVTSFEVTSNGRYVVFTAGTPGWTDMRVYAADLSIDPPAAYPISRIVPTPGTDAGVRETPVGSNRWFVLGPVPADPTQQRVLFAADLDQSGKPEVYANVVTGTAASMVKLNTTTTTSAMDVRELAFSFDGGKALWVASPAAAGDYHIFARGTADANDTKVNVDGYPVGEMAVSPTADLVVYSQPDGLNKWHLKARGFSDLSSLPSEHVIHTEASNTGRSFRKLRFSPLGNSVAFLHDATSVGVYATWAAQVGASTMIPVHPAGITSDLSVLDGEKTFRFAGENIVVAISDDSAHPGQYSLYRNDLTSPGVGVLSPASTATATTGLSAFVADLTHAFFGSDNTPAILGEHRLYAKAFGAGADSPSASFDKIKGITKLHLPEAGWTFPGLPAPLYIEGTPVTSGSIPEMWLMDNRYSASSNVRRLTHFNEHPNGVGRFKVRLLSYRAAVGGAAVEAGPALESACFSLKDGSGFISQDGGNWLSDLKIPPGNGSYSSPFAVAIDVYGEATDCLGPFSRTLLPYGFAENESLASPPATLPVRVRTSSPSYYVYVRD